MNWRLEQLFHKEGQKNGQWTFENLFDIITYQQNANENHNGISVYIHLIG